MIFGGGLESRLARFLFMPIRTATKRASGGKSANNNTAGRRLGPKKGEGEFVEAGQIIWRQRGTKWFPGENAGIGRDHTIFAREPGYVRYYRDPFHAKRRFIGISLGASERLPTPHFDPRRRRFGYTPIENEEVAQFELEYLTRKETQRLSLREQVLAERDAKQQQRFDKYQKVLSEAGATDISKDQLRRLDSIYQFMCGGLTYAEAKETVDLQSREDFDVDLRVGHISEDEHNSQVSTYSKDASLVDGLVGFSASRELAPLKSLDASVREEAISRIEDLTKPHMDSSLGTPSNVVTEVFDILKSTPAFSPADVAHLKARYLRRPSPILISKENKSAMEEKAKKGDGEIRDVWDEQTRSTKRYFVPNDGKLIF